MNLCRCLTKPSILSSCPTPRSITLFLAAMHEKAKFISSCPLQNKYFLLTLRESIAPRWRHIPCAVLKDILHHGHKKAARLIGRTNDRPIRDNDKRISVRLYKYLLVQFNIYQNMKIPNISSPNAKESACSATLKRRTSSLGYLACCRELDTRRQFLSLKCRKVDVDQYK